MSHEVMIRGLITVIELTLLNYQCNVLLNYLGPLGRMVQSVQKELPHCNNFSVYVIIIVTREGFLRKNIVAVSFFQNCAIHQYS